MTLRPWAGGNSRWVLGWDEARFSGGPAGSVRIVPQEPVRSASGPFPRKQGLRTGDFWVEILGSKLVRSDEQAQMHVACRNIRLPTSTPPKNTTTIYPVNIYNKTQPFNITHGSVAVVPILQRLHSPTAIRTTVFLCRMATGRELASCSHPKTLFTAFGVLA